MRVKTHAQTEVPDERGTDLLKGIRSVDLIGLTPNMVRALLLLFPRVGGSADTTLRGEIGTVYKELLAALGVPGGSFAHSENRRYMRRNDMADGYVSFLKGGAHV